MRDGINAGDSAGAGVRAPNGINGDVGVHGQWTITARDPDGNIIREETFDNLVVDEGLNALLSATLAGGAQSTSWYIGLTDSSPTTAAGDTLGSAPGWSEVTGYDEASRQTWTPGSVSGQSVDNSGSVATFTISSDGTTIGGAFLADDNTTGGTTGTLYSVGAFSGGDVTLSAGSTLEVTATFTTAAS